MRRGNLNHLFVQLSNLRRFMTGSVSVQGHGDRYSDSYRFNDITTPVDIAPQKLAHLGQSDMLARQVLQLQKLRLRLSDSFLTLKRTVLYQKSMNNFRRAR
jgi:hypothetical protein